MEGLKLGARFYQNGTHQDHGVILFLPIDRAEVTCEKADVRWQK